MSGEVGRIQGGPWRVRLAVVARLRLVSDGGLVSFERARGAIGGLLAVFGFGLRWFQFVLGSTGYRFSIGFRFVGVGYGFGVAYLPCVRCLALFCVALRSFYVFRSG